MKVDQFCSFPYGGAGSAARRLHESLRREGVDSRLRYWRDKKHTWDDPSYVATEFECKSDPWLLRPLLKQVRKARQKRINRQYQSHLSKREKTFEVFSTPQLLTETPLDYAQLQSDVIHLHWISFFLDYPSFFASIPSHVPIVWTMHDMNPMTGGCHYSSGCDRYTSGCGHCPQIRQPGPKDVSYDSFRVKRRALKSKQLHIVTPSRWLSELAQQSKLFPSQTTFHVIHLGFDLQTLRPIDKQHARQQLGLPAERFIVAFGAEDINNHRKGFHHLVEALGHLADVPQLMGLVMGSGKLPKESGKLPPMHPAGFVDSLEKQALLYAAADLFILPSREDNQPQMGLESMACGTPVVGFDAGGIPEYVRQHQTGLLAPVGRSDLLAKRIQELVDHPVQRQQMARQAREMVEREFENQTQARKYLQLYEAVSANETRHVLPHAA